MRKRLSMLFTSTFSQHSLGEMISHGVESCTDLRRCSVWRKEGSGETLLLSKTPRKETEDGWGLVSSSR